jgi:hypothetical protein
MTAHDRQHLAVDKAGRRLTHGSQPTVTGSFAPRRPGCSAEAVQIPARVNVTCVTPLGEEVASIS